MMTLVDTVVYKRKSSLMEGVWETETCTLMTRRIRHLFINRSRTTVLPHDDCGDDLPGFILWWNTHDADELNDVHAGMVEVIRSIGFVEPAIWCHNRHKNRSRHSIRYYWHEKLGDLFVHFRKAT